MITNAFIYFNSMTNKFADFRKKGDNIIVSEEYMLIYRKSRTSTGSFLCFANFKLIFILTPHHDLFSWL